MWQSRTKHDLIIEVWEKLDCENVGAVEIEAIEQAVTGRFGDAAVESPMKIARLLADEGAALRHSEIMDLWVRRFNDQPHGAEFRNLIKTADLDSVERSIRQAENLRKKFVSNGDIDGLRQLRSEVIDVKSRLLSESRDKTFHASIRRMFAEMAEWLTLWLQSPEVFENWIRLRRNSAEFKKRYYDMGKNR
jgi:hypothetical protein